jgi:hypothetical protein
MHDSMFDQQSAKNADFRLEIVHCTEQPLPWLGFCLLVVVTVLALGLALLVAICFRQLLLWLSPAQYVPLGYVRSGGEEGLVKISVCLLLLMWKNIPETRKQVGEVDVATVLNLPVHIGQEP